MASTSKSTASPSSMESFAALFEESLARQEMRSGEVITAEVISVDQDHVIVNAGLKSESVIAATEFQNAQGELEVKVGDFVKVAIEKLEDGFGSTVLSREKAKRMETWLDLEDAMNEGRIIKGFVSGKVKGGLRVSVNGIMAFLPGSLVDVRPVNQRMGNRQAREDMAAGAAGHDHHRFTGLALAHAKLRFWVRCVYGRPVPPAAPHSTPACPPG